MSGELKQLCELIDNQDVASLSQFLTEHQLDLNNVTASGCSALWYALTPPKNKEPSLAVIQELINTGRINPTLTHHGIRYNMLTLSPPIKQAIKTYEDQYQNPRYAQFEVNIPNRLAQIAGQAQNTHDSTIVKGVDDSIIHLLKRYGVDDGLVPEQITALTNFINDLKKQTGINIGLKVLNDALTAISRISRDMTTRDYKLSPEETRKLTNAAVLALMFEAASDKNIESFVNDADMSDAEVLARKLRLIKHLAQSQNEYGDNSASCWMGTRNQIVASLDMTHVDIRIKEEINLTPEVIAMKYHAFCQKKLLLLENGNALYFDRYLHYYALRDLPDAGGFAGEDTEIPEDLKQFVKNIHEEFKQTILQENKEMRKPLKNDQLDIICDGLFQESTYSNDNSNSHLILDDTGYRAIVEFRRLAEINYSTKDNTPIAQLIPKTKLSDLRKMRGKNLAEKVTSLKQSLIKEVDLDALYEYLTSNPEAPKTPTRAQQKALDEYQKSSLYLAKNTFILLLNQVDQFKKTEILKNAWPKMLEGMISGTDNKHPEQVLWDTIQIHVSEVIPDISNWFTGLPTQISVNFFKQLVDEKLLLNLAANKEQIKEKALLIALDSGYFTGLNFKQPFTLENKDLRGKDFGSVNLLNLGFKNCDLRLTNIEKNKTLTSSHLQFNTFSIPSILYAVLKIPKQAGNESDPKLIKALLDNPEITRTECMTYLLEYVLSEKHLDPVTIKSLAQHEKTQLLFERSQAFQGDFIDTMSEDIPCLEAGLSSPYYATPDGIRAMQAGIIRLKAKIKANGEINYERSKNPNSDYNYPNEGRIQEKKDANKELTRAIEIITQKLSALQSDIHAQVIKKPISDIFTPREIYNATTSFCSEYTENVVVPTNPLSHQHREQWIHSVLNDQGEEVGRLLYPKHFRSDGIPHIIYYPGVTNAKDREVYQAPLLADIKKYVDDKLLKDFPDIDFTKAIGHYTLVVGKNQYVAGVSQNKHLDVQGYSLNDKIRSYSAFQTATNCNDRSYKPCRVKSLLETKNAVLSSHSYLLSTQNDVGYSAIIGERLNNAHFSVSDYFYPKVSKNVSIEKNLPRYPNAKFSHQIIDRVNNSSYEDLMSMLTHTQDNNLVKKIIIQLTNDIPNSKMTSGEKIEKLQQVFNFIEKSTILINKKGLLSSAFFAESGMSRQEGMKRIKEAVLNVLETTDLGDLLKEDVENANLVLADSHKPLSEPLKKHVDYLSTHPTLRIN